MGSRTNRKNSFPPHICEASSAGLAPVQQQRKQTDEQKPIHFASHFLTNLENKYITTEIYSLAAVWSIEQFKK